MATKRRKTKSRRKSRKSCKYGKLKRKVKSKSGRKRRCKKKRKRKSKRRRKRKYKIGELELSDMPNEIFANIFENSSLDDLIKLYKINNKSLREQVKKVIQLKVSNFDKANWIAGVSQSGPDEMEIEIIQMLLKLLKDGGIYDQDDILFIALVDASTDGYIEIVRMLLEYGIDPDPVNSIHNPLIYAIENGHIEIVRMLLEYGADPNSNDNYMRSALIYAIGSDFNQDIEIVRLLLDAGADPNYPNVFNHFQMIGGIELISEDIQALLLEYDATR